MSFNKIILSFLFSIAAFISVAQTHVTAPLVRNFPTDTTYAILQDSLLKGGFMVFTGVLNRDSLPQAQRRTGMFCYVVDSSAWFQLLGGIDNSNWLPVFTNDTTTALQYLTAGLGLIGGNYNGSAPQTWVLDTAFINQYIINPVVGVDTSTILVDSIVCASSAVLEGFDYLVCPSPVGGDTLAAHANQIVTRTGGVLNYQTPVTGDQLVTANPVVYYIYTGTYPTGVWVLQHRVVQATYTNYGGNLNIGTSNIKAVNIGVRNHTIATFNTDSSLSMLKFKKPSISSNNYAKWDTATGKLTYDTFKELVAGTNITITSSATADTISSTGGGGGSETWEQTLTNQGVIPFVNDNTVDFGGHDFSLTNLNSFYAATGDETSYITYNSNSATISKGDGTNLSQLSAYNDSVLLYSNNGVDAITKVIIKPQSVELKSRGTNGGGGFDTSTIFKVLVDSADADANNVAWFDANNILHRGHVSSGSSGITALTGDVTASGTGSVAATLATVNSNVGSFGDATHVGAFTVNGKGLITAASSTAITGFASSTLTNTHLFVGNGSNVATDVAASGDLTLANTGAFTIANNAVTNAKLRQSVGLSVIGNSTNSTANVADITAASDNQILRRSGTAIGFGSIDLSQSNAVGSSILGATNGGTSQSTYTTGDILYASASNTLSKLPIGTAKQTLHIVSGVPAWRDTATGGGGGSISNVVNSGIRLVIPTKDSVNTMYGTLGNYFDSTTNSKGVTLQIKGVPLADSALTGTAIWWWGASITSGSAATSGLGYVDYVGRSLNLTSTNKGITGTTFVSSVASDSGFTARWRAGSVPAYSSAIRYIVIGGDYLINGLDLGYPFQPYMDSISAYIDSLTINKGYPLSSIVLTTASPIGNNSTYHKTDDSLTRWNNALKSIAATKQVQLVDMHTYMVNNGYKLLLSADSIHPTTVGHYQLYKAFMAANGGGVFNASIFANSGIGLGINEVTTGTLRWTDNATHVRERWFDGGGSTVSGVGYNASVGSTHIFSRPNLPLILSANGDSTASSTTTTGAFGSTGTGFFANNAQEIKFSSTGYQITGVSTHLNGTYYYATGGYYIVYGRALDGGLMFGVGDPSTFTSTSSGSIYLKSNGNIVNNKNLSLSAGTATAATSPLKFTSGTNLTTAEAGAMEYNGTSLFFTPTGTIRKSIPTNVTGRSTAQTAAVGTVVTQTVGAADASYYVSANVLVTTSSAENFTATVAYTDEGNTARVLTLNFQTIAGTIGTAIAFANGAVPYEGIVAHIRCKATTTITIATAAGGTYTGCTYNVEGNIVQTN